jgi:CRP/FNR family cyclic AMP-dependent transcriptional regulator
VVLPVTLLLDMRMVTALPSPRIPTPPLFTIDVRSAVVDVIHAEPKFSEKFMSHLLTRNARVEADLVDQLFNSSEKRLARTLLLMANFGKEGKPEPVIPKVSQETLAEMVGTTRSRINSFMNKFRRLGFIEYNGEMKVNFALMNMVLHETPQIRD